MYRDLAGKKISVIGAGVSGCAVARLAAKHGAYVFVSDGKKISAEKKSIFAAENICFEEKGNSPKALECDEMVVSSGIPPCIPIVRAAEENGVKVTGELDFAVPYLKGEIIAVTGSNGKTTTCSLLAELLEKSGYKSTAAGNIGLGVAELADKEFDYIAMELSSFQLYWSHNYRCRAGIITNLAPDHLNWHGTYENYVAAKANLFHCIGANGAAICQKRDENVLNIPSGTDIYTLSWENNGRIFLDRESEAAYLDSEKLFDFSEIKLLGDHNLENCAMALSALKLSGAKVKRELLAQFKAPEHRCEYVGEVKDVLFVNDSKGTNVAAAITAITSLPRKKIIILGGQGKGEDYTPLAENVVKYIKKAVVLGSEREKIAQALDEAGFENYELAENMKDAVEKAYASAKQSEMVLLSPACTSWDMYPDFETRGEDFRAIAASIIEREKNV